MFALTWKHNVKYHPASNVKKLLFPRLSLRSNKRTSHVDTTYFRPSVSDVVSTRKTFVEY